MKILVLHLSLVFANTFVQEFNDYKLKLERQWENSHIVSHQKFHSNTHPKNFKKIIKSKLKGLSKEERENYLRRHTREWEKFVKELEAKKNKINGEKIKIALGKFREEIEKSLSSIGAYLEKEINQDNLIELELNFRKDLKRELKIFDKNSKIFSLTINHNEVERLTGEFKEKIQTLSRDFRNKTIPLWRNRSNVGEMKVSLGAYTNWINGIKKKISAILPNEICLEELNLIEEKINKKDDKIKKRTFFSFGQVSRAKKYSEWKEVSKEVLNQLFEKKKECLELSKQKYLEKYNRIKFRVEKIISDEISSQENLLTRLCAENDFVFPKENDLVGEMISHEALGLAQGLAGKYFHTLRLHSWANKIVSEVPETISYKERMELFKMISKNLVENLDAQEIVSDWKNSIDRFGEIKSFKRHWKKFKIKNNGKFKYVNQGECLVCSEKTDLLAFECGHVACETCWKGVIQANLSDTKMRVTCPDIECKENLSLKALLKFGSKFDPLKIELEYYRQNTKLPPDTLRRNCLHECPGQVLVRDKKGTCNLCKRYNDYTRNDFLAEAFTRNKDSIYRTCPQCQVVTEKIEGCNRIECKTCYFEWDWNTKEDWNETRGYDGRTRRQIFNDSEQVIRKEI